MQRSLASAIGYATAHGASVISMSLGYGSPSALVRSALQKALNHGIVVVALYRELRELRRPRGPADRRRTPSRRTTQGCSGSRPSCRAARPRTSPVTTCLCRWARQARRCPRKAGMDSTGWRAGPARRVR